VEGEVEKFSTFIDDHQEGNSERLLIDSEDPAVCYKALGEYSEIFLGVFTKKFYILISCSNGTVHQNSREIVIEYIKEHFVGHAIDQGMAVPELDKTAIMLANGFLDGVLHILKNNEDKEIVGNLLKNHMMFFFMGMLGIIRGCSGGLSND
jgi:hypothetical protein